MLVGAAFCTLAIATVIYGARGWFLPVASRHGHEIDKMMVFLLLATGAMFLVGHIVLGYAIWRFSRQRRVTYRMASPKVERLWSIALGVLMALIAEGGVLVIGLPVWTEYYLNAPPAEAITIEVTGEQFAWNVRYPGRDGVFGRSVPALIGLDNTLGLDAKDSAAQDDLILLGVMYLPVDRPARIRLRSKDVIHGFYLPHFRVKQDVVPGMNIDIWFVPTEQGTYEIACTELCGFSHYKMRAVLHVVGEKEFEEFLEEEPPFL